MTATPPPGAADLRDRRTARRWATGYLVLAVVGLTGTWWFNLRFAATGSGSAAGYLQAWFANPASSSAAVDVVVTAVVACLFYVRESRRPGWRWILVLVPLTFAVALAFTFPLFLALRELRPPGNGSAPGTAPHAPVDRWAAPDRTGRPA